MDMIGSPFIRFAHHPHLFQLTSGPSLGGVHSYHSCFITIIWVSNSIIALTEVFVRYFDVFIPDAVLVKLYVHTLADLIIQCSDLKVTCSMYTVLIW